MQIPFWPGEQWLNFSYIMKKFSCKMHHSFSIIWSQGSIITWSFSSFLIGNITITTYSLISLLLVFVIFVHNLWDIFSIEKSYSCIRNVFLPKDVHNFNEILVKSWLFDWLQEYVICTPSQVIMPLFGFYYRTNSIITRSWL